MASFLLDEVTKMIETKQELEEILEKLASKKSRQKFFETAIINQRIEVEDVPEKYVDDLLDMVPGDSRISINGGPWRENPDKRNQLVFMAEVAGHVERYETAAWLYYKADCIKEAVDCAKKADLHDLAYEWADEYIKKEMDDEQAKLKKSAGIDRSFKQHLSVISIGANAAKWLGYELRAKEMVLAYFASVEQEDLDAEQCEELAEFASEFTSDSELHEQVEKFGKRAMKLFEEDGEYDYALRVARRLDDPEKIEFYDNLRYLVANPMRREQIDEERDEERDAQK